MYDCPNFSPDLYHQNFLILNHLTVSSFQKTCLLSATAQRETFSHIPLPLYSGKYHLIQSLIFLKQHSANRIFDKVRFLSQKSLGWPRVPPGTAGHLNRASAVLHPASACFSRSAHDTHWDTICQRNSVFYWLETIYTSHGEHWHCDTLSHTVWGWVRTTAMSGAVFQAQGAGPRIHSQVGCVEYI